MWFPVLTVSHIECFVARLRSLDYTADALHQIVNTREVDALVTIDGSLIGKSPYGPIELEPGEHSVRVESERFLPFEDLIMQVMRSGRFLS